MPRSLIFWMLMILWALSGAGILAGYNNVYVYGGHTLLEFVLFGLLGWAVYGSAIK